MGDGMTHKQSSGHFFTRLELSMVLMRQTRREPSICQAKYIIPIALIR